MKRVAVVLLFLALSQEAQLRTVTTYAGARGMKGAIDGQGSAARFTSPQALVTDRQGNLYVADNEDHTVRKVTPAGKVTTLAGYEGADGFEDSPAGNATFGRLSGSAVAGAGNVYVRDTSNHTIRNMT